MRKVNKTKMMLVVTLIVMSIIVALVAAVSVFTSLNQGYAGDKFENSLWEAKKLVAEEIGYEGSLDSEHFQVYDDYSFLIWEDGVVKGSGTFSSPMAKAAMDRAMTISDGHQSRHSKDNAPSIGYELFVWILTVIVFFVVAILMSASLIYGLYCVLGGSQHADATDATDATA